MIGEPGDAIATVGLTERIDPSRAPYPSNDSERLLFRQVYETLVHVDCRGEARPGLATSWRLDRDQRTWILTLRENARYADDTPVTAGDVRAGWTLDGGRDELRPDVTRLVESIVAIDDRTLAIRLRSSRVDAPMGLAHTDLAIARRDAAFDWPLGTRPNRSRLEREAAAASADVITLRRENVPSVRFLVARGDPRDLLDRGVDLLVTRDPATLDYAATQTHFQALALDWQRTHVLLLPGRPRTSPPLSDDARRALAADAVRGEARGAVPPFWWQALPDCQVASYQPRERSSFAPRIVYDATDSAARELAERFVGLARASGSAATTTLDAILPDRPRRAYQRATGLTGEPLSRARRLGTDAGYIMALDRHPLDACRELDAVLDTVRWLNPEVIVPLIDTRLHAIVRRGRSGLATQWDGGLLIAGASAPR